VRRPPVEVDLTMGPTRRLAGLLAFTASATIVFVVPSALPARADDTVSVKPKVVQSNWYWYHQAQAAEGTGVEALPEPSGVPNGDLAVTYTPNGTPRDPNEPSKETLLAFDLSGWPRDATVSTFSFTVKLDGPAQVKASQPALIACLPQGLWRNGAGDPYVDKPGIDCSSTISSAGRYDAASATYTFAIPAIAQRWISDVNTGVSIRQAAPASGSTQPFQLTFTGPDTVTASGSYTPAAPVTDEVPPPTQPNPQAGTPAAPSNGGAGSTGGLTSTGALDATTPAAGGTAAAAPQVAPTPQLAPASSALPHIGKASSAPSIGFWLFGLALLVLLTLVSLALGDVAGAPAAGSAAPARRGSRLDRALRHRRLSATRSLTLEPR
jgi:hypothetical protein